MHDILIIVDVVIGFLVYVKATLLEILVINLGVK